MTTSRSKKAATKAKEEPKLTTLFLAHNKFYDEWEVFYNKRDVQVDSCDAYIAVKVPRIQKKTTTPPCIGVVELEVVDEVAA